MSDFLYIDPTSQKVNIEKVSQVNINKNQSFSYTIPYSIKINSALSQYLTRTPTVSGSTQKFTYSFWMKTSDRFIGTDVAFLACADGGTVGNRDVLWINATSKAMNLALSNTTILTTSQVLRDSNAWYHIVLAIDTTQYQSFNRVKLYINGSQVVNFSTASYPAQNANFIRFNTANEQIIGAAFTTKTHYFDGYLAEVNFVDGYQFEPTEFGFFDNVRDFVWKPKKYTGIYGANGFYLNFSNTSNLGLDTSGNGNHWTAVASPERMIDSPTNEYPIINSSDRQSGGTTSNAGLTYTLGAVNTWRTANAGIFVSSGKWYWEVVVTAASSNNLMPGIVNESYDANTDSRYPGSTTDSYGYYGNNGNRYLNAANTAYGATFTTGDIIGFALDMDNKTLTCYKNNVSQGLLVNNSTYILSAGAWGPSLGVYNSNGMRFNFGQQSLTYTPPSGFRVLSLANVQATLSIKNTRSGMATILYPGTSTIQTISGFPFNPGLIWIKKRSGTGEHVLIDSIRGGDKQLFSSSTAAEQTNSNITSAITADGFTVGTNATGTGDTNATAGGTYVAWAWNAGLTTASNNSGSITSSVRANTQTGFSIVSYTGAGATGTVGHGLGVVPAMFIVKSRNAVGGWPIYHKSLGNTGAVQLESTGAFNVSSTYWNNTSPTSSVFTVNAGMAANGTQYIAYCFTEIEGYSKFDSYVGTGVADGPFIYCGFRPKWVMCKSSSIGGAGYEWLIFDVQRKIGNENNVWLIANANSAETTDTTTPIDSMDILSNGFKIRGADSRVNASTRTYIFAAFAENPYRYANAM
jgi:hypothetical protein